MWIGKKCTVNLQLVRKNGFSYLHRYIFFFYSFTVSVMFLAPNPWRRHYWDCHSFRFFSWNWLCHVVSIKKPDNLHIMENFRGKYIHIILFLPMMTFRYNFILASFFIRLIFVAFYSCNNIITTQIEISRQNWNAFFSNISHQMMI